MSNDLTSGRRLSGFMDVIKSEQLMFLKAEVRKHGLILSMFSLGAERIKGLV